jgi:hypothetical protein
LPWVSIGGRRGGYYGFVLVEGRAETEGIGDVEGDERMSVN